LLSDPYERLDTGCFLFAPNFCERALELLHTAGSRNADR